MITGFTVLVRLCDACGLTHGEMITIRERAEKVLHSDSNRKGKVTYAQICLTLALAIAFGGVQPALDLSSAQIIHRAKKPDIKTMVNHV